MGSILVKCTCKKVGQIQFIFFTSVNVTFGERLAHLFVLFRFYNNIKPKRMSATPALCNYTYNPTPPRVWSRVQSTCTFEPVNPSNGVEQQRQEQLRLKRNVLQHRHNSTPMTANQRFAKAGRGEWTVRSSTWATQNDRGYTNPNNKQLLRINTNANLIADTMQPTTLPVTCDPRANPKVIASGGTLVCGTRQNPCTGEIEEEGGVGRGVVCVPTSASNVPGPVRILCGPKMTRKTTWNPRRRLTMPAGGGQFPTNYKHLTSAYTLNDTPAP